jgi:hypothetical protein
MEGTNPTVELHSLKQILKILDRLVTGTVANFFFLCFQAITRTVEWFTGKLVHCYIDLWYAIMVARKGV